MGSSEFPDVEKQNVLNDDLVYCGQGKNFVLQVSHTCFTSSVGKGSFCRYEVGRIQMTFVPVGILYLELPKLD